MRSLRSGGITSPIYPYTIFGPYLPAYLPNILQWQPRVFEFDVNGGAVPSFHGGQGESLVHPYTRGSVSLSVSHTLSQTGGKAKAWCLLRYAEASLN